MICTAIDELVNWIKEIHVSKVYCSLTRSSTNEDSEWNWIVMIVKKEKGLVGWFCEWKCKKWMGSQSLYQRHGAPCNRPDDPIPMPHATRQSRISRGVAENPSDPLKKPMT